MFFFTLKGMSFRAQLVFFSHWQFYHFCNNWLFCCPWSQLQLAHTNNFFGINNTKKSVAKCLKKNSSKRFTFSWTSLRKVANNNSSLTLTFSFKKKPQKVGFRNKYEVFFSFRFLICQKKKGFKRQIVLVFFVEQNQIEVWSKNKGNKKETRRISKSLLLLLSKNCFASRKATILLTL